MADQPQTLPASLRQSFLAGLLALLPLYITVKVLGIVFGLIDGPLGKLIDGVIKSTTGTDLHIPGLGLLGTAILVLLVGWLTRKVFFKQLLGMIEALIDRVPIVRSLYNASRQIVSPFTGKEKLPFSKVCLVEYPMRGRYTLGLVAKERVSSEPGENRMVVFFPSNHLHLGYPVILPSEDVTIIDMSVEDAVKFFVSCGVIGNDSVVRKDGEIVGLRAPALAQVD